MRKVLLAATYELYFHRLILNVSTEVRPGFPLKERVFLFSSGLTIDLPDLVDDL